MVEFSEASNPNSGRTAMAVSSTMTKQQSIKRARQTTMFRPMLAEMQRRAKLKMKPGEVEGCLMFSVDKSNVLHLPLSEDSAPVRTTLFRRIEGISEGRIDDDSSYYNAVENCRKVTIVLPLPEGHDVGGWWCHSITDNGECLHPNQARNDECMSCKSLKPKLKQEFQYLRILAPSIRSESREYLRIIRESDTELTKCESAEKEARERLSVAARKLTTIDEDALSTTSDDEDIDEALMMNVELVESGVWQRCHANTVVSMIGPRKTKSSEMLNSAKAELSIIMQNAYSLAVPHAQKIVRGFLLRSSLDSIKEQVISLARFSAAVEIQRVVRSMLATIEAARLRRLKRNKMATRIQCMFRQRQAFLERLRHWSLYMDDLREKAAIKIQSMYRCHLCKLQAKKMAEERRRLLEELARTRQANKEHDAAVQIQSQVRRRISIMYCANKRVEMGLHDRLLMYIERFTVDGDFFSFMKSLNDDYIRFEKIITSTIEREEKMAKTFVEKVVRARDTDHKQGWENYQKHKQGDEVRVPSDEVHEQPHRPTFVTPTAMMEKLYRDDHKERMPKVNDGRGWERTRNHRDISRLYGSKSMQRPQSQKRVPKTIKVPKTTPSAVPTSIIEDSDHRIADDKSFDRESQIDRAENNDHDDQNHKHEYRLIKMNQMQERLRGHYLRFDIPLGLDDTCARFIMAVAMRYNFVCPHESSLHNGNFVSRGSQKNKERHQESMAYAEPLIQQLHQQGIVFIRQLLPMDHMSNVLSKLKVSDEFLALAALLMMVLHQVTGGNYMSRRYLMAECKHFLATQRELTMPSSRKFGSCLDEFAALGNDGLDTDDIPGGLWANAKKNDLATRTSNLPICNDISRSKAVNIGIRGSSGRRSKTWAVAYTCKVLENVDSQHPAYDQYRHHDLLTQNN